MARTEITEVIGKHKSQLKCTCDNRNKEYKCDLAQQKYSQRQAEKPKKQYFTDEIKRYVLDGSTQYYSPKQIVGGAKLENVPCVSHECICIYDLNLASKKTS